LLFHNFHEGNQRVRRAWLQVNDSSPGADEQEEYELTHTIASGVQSYADRLGHIEQQMDSLAEGTFSLSGRVLIRKVDRWRYLFYVMLLQKQFCLTGIMQYLDELKERVSAELVK
jgi:hypothetical protein